MKILVTVSRIIVGLLFLLSGLIKLNDPVGFSFKLQDYFAPEVLDLPYLIPYALLIALVLVIFEVLLGVMIIIGFARKFTVWSLLILIVFFTFLTFYSAYFNKVTDCGCFGDAIKLTPWESFIKDVILLVFILILFLKRKYITPLFPKVSLKYIVIGVLIACVIFANHVLNHLPVIDFRAYSIGTNIPEAMGYPEDAEKPVYEYTWKFQVNGEEKIITNTGEYPKVNGELLGVDTEQISEGYTPPIFNFTIEKNGQDYTEEMLQEEKLIMVIVYNMENAQDKGFENIKRITDEALQKGYRVIGLSAASESQVNQLVNTKDLNFEFYFCDQTVLKTIVRSNPGILKLERGTIKQKYHWNDALLLDL